jgi:hypothetical protein
MIERMIGQKQNSYDQQNTERAKKNDKKTHLSLMRSQFAFVGHAPKYSACENAQGILMPKKIRQTNARAAARRATPASNYLVPRGGLQK